MVFILWFCQESCSYCLILNFIPKQSGNDLECYCAGKKLRSFSSLSCNSLVTIWINSPPQIFASGEPARITPTSCNDVDQDWKCRKLSIKPRLCKYIPSRARSSWQKTRAMFYWRRIWGISIACGKCYNHHLDWVMGSVFFQSEYISGNIIREIHIWKLWRISPCSTWREVWPR